MIFGQKCNESERKDSISAYTTKGAKFSKDI